MAQIIVRNRVDASWSAFSTSIARLSGQEMGGKRTFEVSTFSASSRSEPECPHLTSDKQKEGFRLTPLIGGEYPNECAADFPLVLPNCLRSGDRSGLSPL